MTRIYSATAAVENGETLVTITAGDPLTAANSPPDAPVSLDGEFYHLAARTSTTTFELTRPYEGADGSVQIEIDPLTPEAMSVVNLTVMAARVQAQLNILDKNSQGLFYNRLGVTGDTDTDPGSLAFDDSDPVAASELYIDNIDGNERSVTGLLDLWTAGTVILVRSLATTAYVSYRLPIGIEQMAGYYKASLEYVDHDGVMADGEAVSVGWFRVGEGLEVDAAGDFAGRAAYNAQPAGFVYLSSNGNTTTVTSSALFFKRSATSGDWGPAIPFQGPRGYTGWAPRFSVVADGARNVMQLVGYVGGEGTAPTDSIGQYLSTGGYTPTIGSATNIRGATGVTGLSAYQVAVVEGFVGTEAAWLASLNGTDGADGEDGLDGTDPGVYFVWDDNTADTNPPSGVIKADNASLNLAGFLYVSKTNRAGDNIAAFLAALNLSDSVRKGTLVLTRTGGNAQAVFDVLGVTDAVGYVKVAIENGAGTTGFLDNDAISMQFSPAGDRGTNGDGAGDVVGPSVSVPDNIASYDGTSGKLLKDSGTKVSDLVKLANNGSDFASKIATADNLSIKGADIASATSINLDTATGNLITITGTTAISGITLSSGRWRRVRAAAALPFVLGTNLKLNVGLADGATYTLAAGDEILFVADGSVIRGIVFPVSGAPIALVTNANLANMSASRIKGRISSTGVPQDLTGTQVTAILNNYVGATSIADGTKGLVPAALIAERALFLRGDGVWAAPSSGALRGAVPSGRLDLWQRGVSLAAANGQRFLADRWGSVGGGTTVAPSQQVFTLGQTDVPGNPKFFHRCVVASVAGAGNYAILYHRVEGVEKLSGQQATVVFYAKADAPKSVSIELIQNFGAGGSPSATVDTIGVTKVNLTTAWQKFSVVVTVPSISGKVLGTANNDHLQLVFWMEAGSTYNSRTNTLGQQSGTFDFAMIDMFPGDVSGVAFPHSYPDIAQVVDHCERYFENIDIRTGTYVGVGQAYNTTQVAWLLDYRRKRAVPTIVMPTSVIAITAPAGSTVTSSHVVTSSGINHARVTTTATTASLVAGNAVALYNTGSDAVIPIDAEL